MPAIEVLHFTGDVTRHELSKGQPLTIGSHSTNDIVIDDEAVELMHCRVSWSKAGFEAVAAGVDGLDVNGTVVQRAVLNSGDTIRFGSVDVRFTDDDSPPAEARPARESKSSPPPAPKSRKPAPVETVDDTTQADSSGGGWNALEALAAEARVPEKPKKRQLPQAIEPDTLEEIEDRDEAAAVPTAEVIEEAQGDQEKLTDRLRTAMRTQRYRPGQEDSLRSPLILGLGATAAVVLLLGGIFFFIASRQDAQAAFDDAKAQFEQAKYAQANDLLLKFLTTYKGHSLEDDARRILGLSQIDSNIRGAAKKWPEGLESLRAFIDNRQELEEFEADREDIQTRAYEIALGATQDAAKVHSRDLIQTGQEAVTILTRFLPEDAQAATLQEIEIAKRASEAEILKHETLTNSLAEIDRYVPRAPAEGESPAEGEAVQPSGPPTPIPALVERRNLLASYPDLVNNRDVVAAMVRILEAERSLATYTEINADAMTDDPQTSVPAALSLIFSARSRLDAVSVGQCVFALSKDAIYGVDTVTGEPVWRRIIGFQSPFYPVEEPTVPSLIVFDTYQSELCRLNRNTGQLIWRQPIADEVRSAPIVHEGQILLPTMGGSLYQIDLQTGRLIGKLAFSQEVTTPVPLSDGKLVVAGNEEVAYVLTGRPFECIGVSYLGQQPGSVTAPLLSMGPYVAMIEGVSSDKSLLRLIDASGNELSEVARSEILGEVYDTPVIRGRDLFVPSTGERVSAYSISDDTNQPPLTVGPTFQVQNGSDNPVFLMTGPDRQLWMTSSALLKLQLTGEALAAESGELPIGEASQPLQYQSGVIFNGRRRSYSSAVTLTPVDRNEQSSEWQAQLGASLLAVSPSGSNLICLTEEGGVFRLTDMGWTSSGFGPEPSTRIPLNPELTDPLLATNLGNGQIAVACGDPEPKLWIINVRGEIERSTLLESPLQAAPIMLGDGIVLPMQGRLRYQPTRPGGAGVQDFTLPTDEAVTSRWLQVVRLSETSIAALTSAGDVLLVVLQSSPRAHLGEVSRFTLPAAVELPLQGDQQFLAVTDVNHNVQLFDTATLSPVAQRSFETGAWGAWSSGGQVFVQTNDGMLNLVSGAELTTNLQIPLQAVLIGPPIINGTSALVTLDNGEVFTWNLQTGDVSDFRWVGAALSQLPIPIGEELLFVTVDGSLIRLPVGSQVAAGPQPVN